ncbi:ABC transporter G family member 23 [Folsomia candida]|uniref:ABC transporter G family member 23 n=1 Tax=Folsomia candida TaxID=158441 RepID=A0A226F062_FOLCA|nr:ABC transporter G family member 23 [Folsomia candida]
MADSYSVRVSHGYKSYHLGVSILTNLSMEVETGTIYGLLGASGCGKTTLLYCILGQKKLDSGHISVMGRDPAKCMGDIVSSIGYMPQEILERGDELRTVLKLEDFNSYVQTLSGGQKRRVSLAVALLNHPKLLILDEPTTGVDPLLRESIWQYIGWLVTKMGTTVIVTTHYTEECRKFDKIGIMRRGRIIAEDNPRHLLELGGSLILEDALKSICKKDKEDGNNILSTKTLSNYKFDEIEPLQEDIQQLSFRVRPYDSYLPEHTWTRDLNNSVEKSLWGRFTQEFTKVSTLTKRNFLLNYRFPMYLAMVLLAPAINTFVIHYTIGRDPVGQVISVFNEEVDCFGGNTNSPHTENDNSWSCLFLKEIGPNIILQPELSWNSAKATVESGNGIGFMYIPANFTKRTMNRYASARFALEQDLDQRNYFLKINVDHCNFRTSFFYSMMCGLSFTLEKEAGTLERTLASGVKIRHVRMSYFLCETVTSIMQVAIVFAIRLLTTGYNIKGSFVLCFAIAFLTCLVSIGGGLLFGAIFSKRLEVTLASIFVMIVALETSGILWPLEMISPYYRWAYMYLNPISLPVEGMRRVWNSGWGLEHSVVRTAFLAPIVWIFVLSMVSRIVRKMQTNK